MDHSRIAVAAVLVLGIMALPAFGRQNPRVTMPAPSASVSPVQAMAVAKRKLGGGTPIRADFEFDEGHWVYGVMIVKGHRISEVEVDPVSGKVVDSESVDPAGEAAELKSELAKAVAAGG